MSGGRRLGAAYRRRVGPDDVGRRVTIRHLIDDEGRQRPTDVVGHLRRWDDPEVEVERRDGTRVVLDARTIVASRVIPEPPVRE